MQDKLNLELKHVCSDFAPLRTALKKAGARKWRMLKQVDYYFNLPKPEKGTVPARLKLRVQGATHELVFYRRPEFKADKTTPAEVKLLTDKSKKLLDFLNVALGTKVVVEKVREQWKLRNAVFNLDTVKGVGGIFEIEVWSTPKDKVKDQAFFDELQGIVRPFLGKAIKGSNENLVAKASSR